MSWTDVVTGLTLKIDAKLKLDLRSDDVL